jgi:tetratricopeptide (TPR) repeat protein
LSKTLTEKKTVIKILDTSVKNDYSGSTLENICTSIINCKIPYEDVAEIIEDKSYEQCEKGNISGAINQLKRIALFYETLENKNDENSRDLADIYLLVGQMLQFASKYDESISWFSRSIVVDDQYSVPYHNLAISYEKSGMVDSAIRCLTQEILLSPGNYYSYLLLADLYLCKKSYDEFVKCLQQLLERDQDNIQALFRLVKYYEKKDATSDISLLYRRILGVNKSLNCTEWLIKIFVLCKSNKYALALKTIDEWQNSDSKTTITHLARAHLYGAQKQFILRKNEVSLFLTKNNEKIDKIVNKLDEFSSVFGRKYMLRISKTLHQKIAEKQSAISH